MVRQSDVCRRKRKVITANALSRAGWRERIIKYQTVMRRKGEIQIILSCRLNRVTQVHLIEWCKNQ
jgi:hypothetical protein